MDMRRAFNWRRIADQAGLAVGVFVVVSPAILVFLWMLSLSLKSELENSAYPPVFIPAHSRWRTSPASWSAAASSNTSGTA